jgi:PIN domain nuclease of toxin-antitoxin system
MLNLDTNILVFYVAGQLRRDEVKALQDDPHWAVSGIVLWELVKLAKKTRFEFQLSDPDVVEFLSRVQVLPITMEIAETCGRLDFESDPADQIISATSIVHRAPLLTRDSKLLASKVVPLALRS